MTSTRPRAPRRRFSTAAVTAALGLLLIVVVTVSAALSGPWTIRDPELPTLTPPQVSAPPSDAPTADPVEPDVPQIDGETGGHVITVVLVVLVVLGIVVAALAVWLAQRWVRRTLLPWLGRQRGERPHESEALTTVQVQTAPVAALEDAATTAVAALRARTAAPDDAIIATWLALEDAAQTSGTTRHPAQTPTEFTVAVLATTPARPDAVSTLLRLYHRARFTDAVLTSADVDTAVAALDTLTSDLAGTPDRSGR